MSNSANSVTLWDNNRISYFTTKFDNTTNNISFIHSDQNSKIYFQNEIYLSSSNNEIPTETSFSLNEQLNSSNIRILNLEKRLSEQNNRIIQLENLINILLKE